LSGYGDTHFIGADVSGTLFEPACYLRGMENVMLDLAEGSEETTALLDKLEAFGAAAAVECVRLGADWIWLGDDIGAQGGMMVSPDLWRAAIKPRLGRIIEAVRAQRPGAYIAYHSCGSMYQIIGDLAEIGVNVLNPIQESAAGMSQQTIKEQFGDRLTLMCGIDTQTFLPFRTPWEVTAETLRLCGALGSDGGFIFAVSHAVQHDTPMENIDAMISALWENNS